MPWGGVLVSKLSLPLCSLRYVTPPSLCVGEGIMTTRAGPGLRSPSGVAVCVFLSVYSGIALMLCHFSAVCVSVCGPWRDWRSVIQHIAAGVLVCRETTQHHCVLPPWGEGRSTLPPCFLNSP